MDWSNIELVQGLGSFRSTVTSLASRYSFPEDGKAPNHLSGIYAHTQTYRATCTHDVTKPNPWPDMYVLVGKRVGSLRL